LYRLIIISCEEFYDCKEVVDLNKSASFGIGERFRPRKKHHITTPEPGKYDSPSDFSNRWEG
jgi:hypothetical protein